VFDEKGLKEHGFDNAEQRGAEAQLQPVNVQGRVKQNSHCPSSRREEYSFS
jgi:hypothetical protein